MKLCMRTSCSRKGWVARVDCGSSSDSWLSGGAIAVVRVDVQVRTSGATGLLKKHYAKTSRDRRLTMFVGLGG